MNVPVISRVVAPESVPDLGKRLPVDTVIIDGEGNPVDLPGPATPTGAGLVKQAASVPDVAASADAATVATAFNGLLASLRSAGVLKA